MTFLKCWGAIWVNFSNGDHKLFVVRQDGFQNYIYDIEPGTGNATILTDDAGNPYALTSLTAVNFFPYNDIVFGCNGTDANFEIAKDAESGTYRARKTGIVIPANAPTLTDSGTAGNPNGTYTYYITFVRKENSTRIRESSSYVVGDAPSITVSSKQINLSNIPISSDPQVNCRRIYRNANSGTAFYKVADIDNNTATSYTDNIADSSLDTTVVYESPEGTMGWAPMPPVKYLTVFKYRMFGWGHSTYESRLYYSYSGSMIALRGHKSTFWKDIDDMAGQDPKGLAIDDNGLIIFKERSTFMLANGNIINPIQTINNSLGCMSNNSIAYFENGFVCYTHQGLRMFYGGNFVDEDLSYNVSKYFENSDPENIYCRFKNKELWIAMDDNSTENNIILVRDFKSKTGWRKHININASYILLTNENKLLSCDSFDGCIYEQQAGYTDKWNPYNTPTPDTEYDGDVIEFYIRTKDYFLNDLQYEKELATLLSLMNNGLNVSLEIYKNFARSSEQYIIDPNLSGYFNWGTPFGLPWIRGIASKRTRLRFSERGVFFGLGYKQGASELGDTYSNDGLLQFVGFTLIMLITKEDG